MKARTAFPLAVVLVPLVMFWRLWTPTAADRLYIQEGDLSSQYLPLRAYAAERLSRGELPLWNPYVFAGQPALADIQTAALYPPSLVLSLATGGALRLQDLQAQVLLHLALAALGTYCFTARLTGSRPAGAVGALAFSLGGYLTSFPVQQITILSTVAWLPFLLLAVDAIAEGRALPRSAAALAVLFAAMVLAGHPQTAMLVTYVVLAYAARRLARPRSRRRPLIALLAGLGLGVTLASVQLLPTLEFIAHSTRSGLGFEASAGGFELHEIAALLFPGYLGGSPQYAGVVVLLLGLLAMAAVPWTRIGFWVVLGGAGLVLSFGGNTALGTLAYVLLPGISTSRNQERAILWFAFAAAVLAAFGFAALLGPEKSRVDRLLGRGRRLLGVGTGIATGFGLLLFAGSRLPIESGVNLFGGILKQQVWVILVLGLLALFVFWHGRGWVPRSWLVGGAAALLAANLLSVNWTYHLGPAPAAVEAPSAGLASRLRTRLQPGYRLAGSGLLPEGPNAGILYHLPDTTGNTPLILESILRLQRSLPEWKLRQLLAIKYILLPQAVPPDAGLALEVNGNPALYNVVDAVPPVRLAHDVIPASGQAALDALTADLFDPRTQAVVSEPVATSPAIRPETVEVIAWSPERIAVETTVSAPALLSLSLVAYPGWRAKVDGAPTNWVTTNEAFIGVPLSPGRHEVLLEYVPLSVTLGALLSGASLVLVLVGALVGGGANPARGER